MSESENKSSFATELIYWAIIICAVGFLALTARLNFIKEPNTSPANACINNLRQIDGAKNEWALEHHATNGDAVTANQLTNYLIHAKMPKCPSGGIYTIGKIGETPTCSIGTNSEQPHVLQ